MHRVSSLVNWTVPFLAVFTLIIVLHLLFEAPLNTLFAGLLQGESSTLVGLFAVLALTADVLLPIPSSVIAVASVLNLGFGLGFLTVWFGLCLSCCFAYYLGVVSQNHLLRRFFNEKDLQRAQELSERWGLWALIYLRAVPVMAEASVIAAGWVKMPLPRFVLVTALGNAAIALVYAGIATWAAQETSFILAFVASVALPGCILLLWKKVAHRTSSGAAAYKTLKPEFNIRFQYPLHFTHGVFDKKNACLADLLHSDKSGDATNKVQALFYLDEGLHRARPKLENEIQDYCRIHNIQNFSRVHIVPGGDAAKTQIQIDNMYEQMLDVALDRQSYVIAIGGGGVLDAVGYAAATFHRGIRLVRMPTTVLAQNDAGVGVKNGINARGIKNLYGSFAVPTAIINDLDFLKTLSKRDFRSGFAEAIKVALIRDAKFFYWIEKSKNKLNCRDEQASLFLIRRCAELHLQQICFGGDPFEQGSARPLDYGHWAAHKLEALTQHELSHGEAVAIGMALDALYAAEINLCQQAVAERVIKLISALGFKVWHPALAWENNQAESVLLKGLEEFRQHLGGNLCITLLTGIGSTVELDQINTEALLRARDKLKFYENSRAAAQSSDLLQ